MDDDTADDTADDMERPPWWMSSPNESDDTGEQRSGGQGPGLGDMWSMLGMLANMRDIAGVGGLGSLGGLGNIANLGSVAGEWWEASGASTHTEHDDPSAHPECLICKVLVGLQSVSQQAPGPTQLPPARWLGVRRA